MINGKIRVLSNIDGSIEKNKNLSGEFSAAGSGTKKHDNLLNRDLPDQHPISAITNLEEVLDEKLDSKTALPLIEEATKNKAKGLYYDAMKQLAKKSYWYLTSEIDPVTKMGTKESIISGPYDLGQGGGGGGGSLTKVTIKQVDWPATVVLGNENVKVTINWTSLMETEPTGNGTLYLTVNEKQVEVKSNQPQGNITFNISDYIVTGNNTIQIKVMDAYGTVGTTIGTLNAVTLELKSNFDYTIPYPLAGTTGITYTYIPYGDLEKTVYFIIDGSIYDTTKVLSTGDQQSIKINSLTHGSHKLEVYFTANISGETVQSNTLTYDLIYYIESDPTPIIASNFTDFEQEQFISFNIPYRVFISGRNLFDVDLIVDGVVQKSITVNASEQIWNYKNDVPGNYILEIRCGITSKTFNIHINKSSITIEPVKTDLALALGTQGRSNSEALEKRVVWEDKEHNIKCNLTNFNWSSDGWLQDSDGNSMLRLTGDARVEIPYKPFEDEFNRSGKTIELEIATSTVRNYESKIISCLDKNYNDSFDIDETIMEVNHRKWGFKTTLTSGKFKEKVGVTGSYIFTYNGANWTLNGVVVDLNDYGINVTHTQLEEGGTTEDPYYYEGDLIKATYESSARGFYITPQLALFKSQQSSLQTQYKEEEHVRLTFVIEKLTDNRIIWMYLNGIASGAVQYSLTDIFRQSDPSTILIGSNDATVDIYNIRIYNNNLTSKQVVNNWIADTQNSTLKAERYYRNDNYNDKNEITIAKIVENIPELPYIIWDINPLPQYKGDKRLGNVRYVEPMDASRNFTSENATYNVQGTSSAVYPVKNIRIKYKQNKDFPDTFTWYDDNGEDIKKFPVTKDAEPDNYFTYKVDYASSEGANNVELVRLYNDAAKDVNILTPPQKLDSKVRVGIDGYPIIAFHRDAEGKEIFCTKANFNNDKANEDVYGFAEGDESWEITNNSSDVAKFKVAATPENFSNAFEIRYPDEDGYSNLDKLGPMTAWVASTNREKATNEPLSEPITFNYTDMVWAEDGSFKSIPATKTFDHDTEEYRLIKFKAELADWFDVDSTLFYYIFTHLYLMIDSRAKNAFPTYFKSRVAGDGGDRWFWLPYDMDTAIGIDNKGKLVFDYNLEDTDKVDGANVFNGQDSVIWCNLRDSFQGEIGSLYSSLRTRKLISYEETEKRYSDHQKMWSENIFNEDSKVKYITPLTQGNNYLEMLQGAKAEQRKWWLYNRFKYMDSKYTVADAKADFIQFRSYVDSGVDKPSVTITPYADIYATVSYANSANTVVSKRVKRGEAVTLPIPFTKEESFTDQETYIYSASQLKSIGDISPFHPDNVIIGNATKLQELKVGDADPNYKNEKLKVIELGSNILLRSLDVRNCVNYDKSPDLSKCTNIEEIYLDGTVATGVTLPDGGILKVLHLPKTITQLIIKNQPLLTDLTLYGTENLQTLSLENIPSSSINTYEMLTKMKAKSSVRLIGIDETFDDVNKIKELYDILDTMSGLDNTGSYVAKAQVTGTIHINEITYKDWVTLSARYPEVTINPSIIRCQVQFYNDGVLYKNIWVIINNKISEVIIDPTKESTESTVFTFDHWDNWNPDLIITKDLVVNAIYTESIRKYNVHFHKQYDAASWENPEVDKEIKEVDWNTKVTESKLVWEDTLVKLKGWYLSPEGDDKFDFETPIKHDYDLYAQWVDSGLPTINYTRINFNSYLLIAEDNVGISAYQTAYNSTEEPTTWINLETPQSYFEKELVVDKSGYYYLWVKDSNNNTASIKLDVYSLDVEKDPGIINFKILENDLELTNFAIKGTNIKLTSDIDYHYKDLKITVDDALYEEDTEIRVEKNLIIKALCIPKDYTVNFVVGEKGTKPESQTITYLTKVKDPGSQYYIGYIIGSWYLDSSFSEDKKWNFDENIITADIIDDETNSVTLYAKWVEYSTPTKIKVNVTTLPEREIESINEKFKKILDVDYTEGAIMISFTQAQPNSVTINWGDGSPEETSAEITSVAHLMHTYETLGVYEMTIQGTVGVNYRLGDGAAAALIEPVKFISDVDFSWDIQTTASYAFSGASISNLKLTNYMTEVATGAFSACSNITTLEIPDNITALRAQAFASCVNITGKVKLPDTITVIENNAFEYCRNITEINIPKNLKEIAEYCFDGCTNLKSIEIPNNIEQIHQRAFMSCSNLTEVIIPESVKILGTYRDGYQNGGIFRWCSKLSKVIIKNKGTICGRDNFVDCELLKTAGPIGSGCNIEFAWDEKIPDYAFNVSLAGDSAELHIQSVILPNTLKEIGIEAFLRCPIKSINLPNSLIRIGDAAFQRTSLEYIEIPESVKYIGGTILAYCPALSSIKIWTGSIEEKIDMASKGWFLSVSDGPASADPKVHIVKSLDSPDAVENAFGPYWNVNDAATGSKLRYSADLI